MDASGHTPQHEREQRPRHIIFGWLTFGAAVGTAWSSQHAFRYACKGVRLTAKPGETCWASSSAVSSLMALTRSLYCVSLPSRASEFSAHHDTCSVSFDTTYNTTTSSLYCNSLPRRQSCERSLHITQTCSLECRAYSTQHRCIYAIWV